MTAHVGGNDSTLSRVLKVKHLVSVFFDSQTDEHDDFLGEDLIALILGVLVFFLLIFFPCYKIGHQSTPPE